jgi:hypothetical protein
MARSAQNRCFGCGLANEAGLHLEFLLAEDGSVVCLTTISDSFEGIRLATCTAASSPRCWTRP